LDESRSCISLDINGLSTTTYAPSIKQHSHKTTFVHLFVRLFRALLFLASTQKYVNKISNSRTMKANCEGRRKKKRTEKRYSSNEILTTVNANWMWESIKITLGYLQQNENKKKQRTTAKQNRAWSVTKGEITLAATAASF